MPHMYILECIDGSYYTGSTVDLQRRLRQHFLGIGANYTCKHPPVRLVYTEEYGRVSDAFYREKQIQKWSHAKKQALIEGRMGELTGLAKKEFGPRYNSA